MNSSKDLSNEFNQKDQRTPMPMNASASGPEIQLNVLDSIGDAAASLNSLSLQNGSAGTSQPITKLQKTSRAARRREKRAALQRAQETLALKTQSGCSNINRTVECSKLEKQLAARNLRIHPIPSDGDCLYNSIAHQLILQNYPISELMNRYTNRVSDFDTKSQVPFSRLLRHLAAKHIRHNCNEFMPFLFNVETGEPMTKDEFDRYCDNIETTSSWGGQVEVRALSNVLKVPIEILQAEGVPVIVGEQFGGSTVLIVYHRHAFALGEHYNSCIPLETNKNSQKSA